jgi:hypothetical protein
MFSVETCVLEMKKSVKKLVRKYGKANRCRNPRKRFTLLSKSEAYSADVSGQLLADFSSRKLRKLLNQRYKVTARIF